MAPKTSSTSEALLLTDRPQLLMLQASESVSLELLTYSDLETLRAQKGANSTGGGSGTGHHNSTAASAANAKKAELASKRYLILIYSVEFDRLDTVVISFSEHKLQSKN